MRGLTWSYLPTTMLSMADSCIGGKSSINVGKYKNLVGMIYPPEEVLIDPDFARTLSDEQVVEGLCEAVKICFCKDPETFNSYIALNAMPGMSPKALEDVLGLTLEAKRWFIEIDEFDKAERLLLNFGHTFGHAIESATHFKISHGTAVGMGMLCAIALGKRLGRSYANAPRVAQLQAYTEKLLDTVPDKAARLAGVTAAQCFELCKSDKKHEKDNFVFIAIAADGLIERLKLPKNPDNSATLTAAFADILTKYQA
jgi:3-dehydroquinate synthase